MADLLNPDALHHMLDQLDGWEGTTEGIRKTYAFTDFAEAHAFLNRVAAAAQEADHHPDMTIRWNEVTLELRTHSAGGVTQSDLDLAAKVEGLTTG